MTFTNLDNEQNLLLEALNELISSGLSTKKTWR